MGDSNEWPECFPGVKFNPGRRKFPSFSPGMQSFEVEADDDDFICDLPEERVLIDGACTMYQGFKTENHEPFSELKKNMKPLEDKSGILKEVIREGSGPLLSEKRSAKVLYQLFTEGVAEPFDSTFHDSPGPVTISLERGIIPGFALCLESMRVFEVANFIIPASLGFGKGGLFTLLPANAEIYAEVEVVSASLEHQVDEGVESADFIGAVRNKLEGNKAFNAGNYESSIRHYKNALGMMEYTEDATNSKDFRQLGLTINTNLAIAYQKVGQPEKAIERCLLVLKALPQDKKALFHLGRSYLLARQYEKAKETLIKGSELFPHLPEFCSELEKLRECTNLEIPSVKY